MLTKKQIKFLREELETAKNPLFFYDSDGDGLASFLLLYRMHREGKGYRLAATSTLDERFMKKVDEYNPDKIFILDIPVVTQEFVNKAKRPIFWIDHHPPIKLQKVNYFNPLIKKPDVYTPTSRLCYQVSQNENDLWIATAGCLADWNLPNFIGKFIKKYPHLLPKKSDLPTTIFKEKVGKLVKFLFFIQKGPTSEVRKSIKVLTRIDSPDEIFKQSTSQGKFLYKRFENINEKYEEILKSAKKEVRKSKLVLFYYTDSKWSFTANLANELAATNPNKFILITRKRMNLYKCSLRGKNVKEIVEKALSGLEGRGGGHPDACGAVIDEKEWDAFLEVLKEEVNKR